jgi:hypothetical protein
METNIVLIFVFSNLETKMNKIERSFSPLYNLRVDQITIQDWKTSSSPKSLGRGPRNNVAHVRAQPRTVVAGFAEIDRGIGNRGPVRGIHATPATTTIAATAAHAAAGTTMGERDALPPLPLALGPPHLIPPAPTRDPRAIAFLPDLVGFHWVAYAAGSFLVVSHLPSPCRDDNNNDSCSPFFRQVIDLRAPVSAVAWCRRGSGEVAAATDNSIHIFQPAPASSPGLLLWPTLQILIVS